MEFRLYQIRAIITDAESNERIPRVQPCGRHDTSSPASPTRGDCRHVAHRLARVSIDQRGTRAHPRGVVTVLVVSPVPHHACSVAIRLTCHTASASLLSMFFFFSDMPLIDCCRVDNMSPEYRITGLPPG